MTNQKSDAFWDKRYSSDAALGSGVGSKGLWKERKLDLLSKVCRRHRVRSVLDLGCGDLQVLQDWPELSGVRYVGIDFNQRLVEQNRARFPNCEFIRADLHEIPDLNLESPDLVICFDVLFHIQDDNTYDRLCDFIFNCGARAAALTCTVGEETSNGVNIWARDFWKHRERLQLGYVEKTEHAFRLPSERLIAFDLCDPVRDAPTEVVYVCSPDRHEQLCISLRSLLESMSCFDRAVIFSVGALPRRLKFRDPRIIVKEAPALFGGYFYGNKIHLCTRLAPRVVFLDTDTLVLRPIDKIWENKDVDLLARPGAAWNYGDWNSAVWSSTFRRVGASEIPMFNAGCLVFQNQSHRRVQQHWSNYISEYLAGELDPPLKEARIPEQLALALAVASAKLRYSECSAAEHAYGWNGDSHRGAIVFHTGNKHFHHYLSELSSDYHWLEEQSKRTTARRLRRFGNAARRVLKPLIPDPALAVYRNVRASVRTTHSRPV
jgi:SAM-dependent methyltransferase